MELQNRVAVVTGAAVRLGRAMAIALSEAGVKVCLHYRNSSDAAERCVEEIQQRGGQAAMVQADLQDTVAAAQKVLGFARQQFGCVDILINSASEFEPSSVVTTDEELWDRHFDVNLKAPFFLCREFAAQLPPAVNGQIVNIIDWRGLRPVTGHLAYSLTKSALAALTQHLALELAPNIQVNGIAPGAILPPPGADNEYLERLAGSIPLKRSGSPDDICDAVLFLLQSRFITGEILSVAGGEQLGSERREF